MASIVLDHVFKPLKVGDVTFRNRLMMAPMGTGLATESGEVTDRLIAYYAARARGGAGVLDIEMTSVDYPCGSLSPSLLRIDNDSLNSGFAELTSAVKAEGSAILLQISHGGRYSRSAYTGQQPVAPSAIASRFTGEMPRELSIAETEEIIEKFGEAARRAKEAGFDGVEIVACTGYLVSQFLSAVTNKRTDRFGGDVAGRSTFLIEIIRAIRRIVGVTYPISVKLSVDECMPGGNKPEDSQVVARLAAEAGASMIHAWAGWHESPVAMVTMNVPRGYWVPLAVAMKQVVDIPVAALGRINDPSLANSILAEGKADMVVMGRAFIADPDFPNKAMRGDLDDIRKCTACCTCFDLVFESVVSGSGHGVIACSVNAEMGHEMDKSPLPSRKKKVLVVGGGPAGMEAARVTASRGHDVTLWEASSKLGGNLLLAMVPPYKEEWKCLLEYLTGQMKKLGIKVELEKRAKAKDITDGMFDEVIVAVGSKPIIPDIKGIDNRKVVTALGVLGGDQTGQNVVVIGGGMVGCETAEYLKVRGRHVSIVEMLSRIASDIGPTTRWVVLDRIKSSGIQVLTNTQLVGVTEAGVLVESRGETQEMPADSVVIAVGLTSEKQLVNELNKAGIKAHVIGDCASVGKILEAVRAGWETGGKI